MWTYLYSYRFQYSIRDAVFIVTFNVAANAAAFQYSIRDALDRHGTQVFDEVVFQYSIRDALPVLKAATTFWATSFQYSIRDAARASAK